MLLKIPFGKYKGRSIEWVAFFDYSYREPAICNSAGDGQWTEGDPFTDIRIYPPYWAESYDEDYLTGANVGQGSTGLAGERGDGTTLFVWPVRTNN